MNETIAQNIQLDNRKSLKISGITKLESLNPWEFTLITTLGALCIKGSDLEMQLFDIDKGNITITGNIDSLVYSNKSSVKKEKGFIQKLFK